jgi:hypothetical protein
MDSWFFLSFPATLISAVAGPEKAKEPCGEVSLPPEFRLVKRRLVWKKSPPLVKKIRRTCIGQPRRPQFRLFALGINALDVAGIPTGFEIVCDDFPVLHARACALLIVLSHLRR